MTGSRTVAENRQKGSKTSCSGKKLRSAHAHTHTHTHTHTQSNGVMSKGYKAIEELWPKLE